MADVNIEITPVSEAGEIEEVREDLWEESLARAVETVATLQREILTGLTSLRDSLQLVPQLLQQNQEMTQRLVSTAEANQAEMASLTRRLLDAPPVAIPAEQPVTVVEVASEEAENPEAKIEAPPARAKRRTL